MDKMRLKEVKIQLHFKLNDVNFAATLSGNGVKSQGAIVDSKLKIFLRTLVPSRLPNALVSKVIYKIKKVYF